MESTAGAGADDDRATALPMSSTLTTWQSIVQNMGWKCMVNKKQCRTIWDEVCVTVEKEECTRL